MTETKARKPHLPKTGGSPTEKRRSFPLNPSAIRYFCRPEIEEGPNSKYHMHSLDSRPGQSKDSILVIRCKQEMGSRVKGAFGTEDTTHTKAA